MKINVYVYADWNTWSKQFDYRVRGFECKDMILVDHREISVVTPTEKAMRVAAAAILETKANELQAEAYTKALELRTQALELRALEDHSAPADAPQ